MNVWFMRDNHTFERIGRITEDRKTMETKAAALFAEDKYGLLTAYGFKNDRVTQCDSVKDCSGFFDRVEEYVNWSSRG